MTEATTDQPKTARGLLTTRRRVERRRELVRPMRSVPKERLPWNQERFRNVHLCVKSIHARGLGDGHLGRPSQRSQVSRSIVHAGQDVRTLCWLIVALIVGSCCLRVRGNRHARLRLWGCTALVIAIKARLHRRRGASTSACVGQRLRSLAIRLLLLLSEGMLTKSLSGRLSVRWLLSKLGGLRRWLLLRHITGLLSVGRHGLRHSVTGRSIGRRRRRLLHGASQINGLHLIR